MSKLDPNCSLCGQEIQWTDNPATGKMMPIDADRTPHVNTCPAMNKGMQSKLDPSPASKTAQEAPPSPVVSQTPSTPASAPKADIMPRTQFSAIDIAEVSKVTGIPRGFIMLMGEAGRERPFVLGEGLLYKGERKGYRSIQIEIEPIVVGDAKGQPLGFKAKATLWPTLKRDDYEVLKHLPQDPATAKLVLEELSRPFIDYGTATADNVKMKTMMPYLRELASTRARNRVLRLFTACGLTSVEELAEAEVVEPE